MPDFPSPASAAGPETQFLFSRTFDAPRQEVWDAFTQAEHLEHWWGPPGGRIRVARLDLQPGGLFLYSMHLPDGRRMWARFVFEEIAEPARLVWRNGFSDEHGGLTPNPWAPAMPLEMLTTVTFAEADAQTLLTITAVPYHASSEETLVFAGAIQGMKMGFGGSFQILADYLAQRKPRP